MWIRGPSDAPLNERVCRVNGTWFVMSPRARKGAKRRGSLDFVAGPCCRALFRGGGVAVSTVSSKDSMMEGAAMYVLDWKRTEIL